MPNDPIYDAVVSRASVHLQTAWPAFCDDPALPRRNIEGMPRGHASPGVVPPAVELGRVRRLGCTAYRACGGREDRQSAVVGGYRHSGPPPQDRSWSQCGPRCHGAPGPNGNDHAACSPAAAERRAVASAARSPCPLIRRKRAAARSTPSPTQRRIMVPSRHRLRLRATSRGVPM